MNHTMPYRAWLGLGGNIDDPILSMAKALKLLDRSEDINVVAVSKVYRTPPWGKTDQAWFHNACAEIETSLTPLQLIKTCLDVERSLKRIRLERWGPRIIDIDILAMETIAGDAIIMNEAALELPHPRMQERAFVLVPLNDIAPELEVAGQSIAEWNAVCASSEIEKARTDAGWWLE
ncbi:2-amino-4-hydroxy-6-hydroxymethyldihydropteridine diphosphokinase [Brucella gallinifaecis]|uniref:2-amino-4-hydroxy-6-hydroxymethyldihydropteridine pyrophosphokinase n=1 Tax=Brucella gallinifaecis TaxID=215590 RepID=A0A502BMU1_9HYPH|nr:2-amino-4-hydroxy-6-hydroxymethyldihydropteridine diphosphokinase [Brucella gallinifaecis]TPF75822.1 2-amino-4-hydroxy-6-hydroxymethyldihydropteridine diphosphokinase [Brucella gallinifaecis]